MTSTDEEVNRAVTFILRSTASRPQTEAEVRERLAGRDVDTWVADAAITRARELGAIDDAAFARAWVADRGERRGYGIARVRQELSRRQVPEHLAEDALAPLIDRDDHTVATDLARRRAQALPPTLPQETVARRLVGYLARRGYSEALSRRVAIEVSALDRLRD